MEMKGARYMRLLIRPGVANIHEPTFLLIEFFLGVVNLNLENFHARSLRGRSIKLETSCPQQNLPAQSYAQHPSTAIIRGHENLADRVLCAGGGLPNRRFIRRRN